ncbi:BadF/BadG/BcrA/BcrD ATPase family protein [Actinacidiphila sp. bgisy144]|uniref:BadF/BadG/BcrA/BcrD ATPase family protein n=1 Tax=Actinacidiphila sp. bgisy144 TaxID=3413791 RepID=UPI003EB8E1C2
MTAPDGEWVLLEGGGSRTWAALSRDGRERAAAEGSSTNPRSVGAGPALDGLGTLLAALRPAVAVPGGSVRGVVAAHGAASTAVCARQFASLVRHACELAGLGAAPVLVTNDIAPLLLADGPAAAVCAVVAGTGTGFAAGNGQRWARASGLEWLLGDEGGGYDLAVSGLRAAVRAVDGRGPRTALTGAAREWCGRAGGPRADAPLGEALFAAVHAARSKAEVADFAPYVLRWAQGGDHVAAALVEAAAEELSAGVLAVTQAAGIGPGTPYGLVLAGSLLTAAEGLRGRLLDRLAARAPWTSVRYHTAGDNLAALLRLAGVWRDRPDVLARLAGALPTHVDAAPRGPSARAGGLPAGGSGGA